jgi:hypothetical protein
MGLQEMGAHLSDVFAQGGCTCKAVRYSLSTKPLIVHCCHCTWCQRETGTAFALNALIESDRVTLQSGTPELVNTPSASGRGQKIFRCPHCRIALWSHYFGAGDAIRFVRVGTLDEPNLCPPAIHIFTSSKQAWVLLPEDKPVVPAYYKRGEVWSEESLERGRSLYASGA